MPTAAVRGLENVPYVEHAREPEAAQDPAGPKLLVRAERSRNRRRRGIRYDQLSVRDRLAMDAEFIEDWQEGPDGKRLTADDTYTLANPGIFTDSTVERAAGTPDYPLDWTLDQVKRHHMACVLEACDGNKSAAARRLEASDLDLDAAQADRLPALRLTMKLPELTSVLTMQGQGSDW